MHKDFIDQYLNKLSYLPGDVINNSEPGTKLMTYFNLDFKVHVSHLSHSGYFQFVNTKATNLKFNNKLKLVVTFFAKELKNGPRLSG